MHLYVNKIVLLIDQMEEWKIIDKFPDYYISSYGRVKSLKWNKERILADRINGCGYKHVILLKDGIETTFRIHQLVANAFIPNINPKEKFIVDHIDRCRTNNNVTNLRWVNKSENILNSHRIFLPMYGITMYKGKLFKVQINVYRKMTYLGCFNTLLEAQNIRDKYLQTLGRK